MAEEPPPQLPIGDRAYLACRRCRLVLTEQQFLRDGCSLCGTGPVRREELLDVATADFTNFVGLIAPEKSWVARLIGKTDCPNGVFAAALDDEEMEEEDEEEDAAAADDDDEDDGVGDADEADEVAREKNDGAPKSDRNLPPVMTDDELLATAND
ncbi:hypothetical protein DQ04_01291130 [Trypanosoma grayi]|uniref:hypothetical protein n=1 Tax=Trypanosoma grayi TaxID=71804 RepID=UPI0004F40521|nr:hypothetical protein DQ04_01291130 [Trypanosoma grayi]KEG12983.1 hypothetical protein DQ04_01291130 [Trypanosoma grayi]